MLDMVLFNSAIWALTCANQARVSLRNSMSFFSTPLTLDPRREKYAFKATRPAKKAGPKLINACGTGAIISFMLVFLSSFLRVATKCRIPW